jgi:hypothetical protein
MKNVRGKKTCGEGSKTSNLGSIESSIPPMQHLFQGMGLLVITMFLETNGVGWL